MSKSHWESVQWRGDHLPGQGALTEQVRYDRNQHLPWVSVETVVIESLPEQPHISMLRKFGHALLSRTPEPLEPVIEHQFQFPKYSQKEAMELFDLADVLPTWTPDVAGYALPEQYHESIGMDEMSNRLNLLVKWLTADSEYEHVEEAYRRFYAATASDTPPQKRLPESINGKVSIEDSMHAASAYVWAKQRHESRRHTLSHKLGLSAYREQLSPLGALARSRNPQGFIHECIDEFSELDALTGEYSELLQQKANAESVAAITGDDEAHQAEYARLIDQIADHEQMLRLKQIRICYLAMLHDQGEHLPVAHVTTPREQLSSPVWSETIAFLHSIAAGQSPARDLALRLHERLLNVSGADNDDALNDQIAALFRRVNNLDTLTHSDIAALERHAVAQFGTYLALGTETT